MMKRLLSLGLVVLLGCGQFATAQTTTDVTNVARAELKTRKSALMARAMGLNDQQSEIFWPIYRQYENEVDKLLDQRIDKIRSYAENYESMTDKKADGLAKEFFKLGDERLALRQKYYKSFSSKINPIIAVRFVQVDRQINTLLDFEIMQMVPLVATPEELGVTAPAK